MYTYICTYILVCIYPLSPSSTPMCKKSSVFLCMYTYEFLYVQISYFCPNAHTKKVDIYTYTWGTDAENDTEMYIEKETSCCICIYINFF